MATPFLVHWLLNSVVFDRSLDRLIRSNDPDTKRRLNSRVRAQLATISKGDFSVQPEELVTLTHSYAEQYVHDLCGDMDTYFAIANGRYFVPHRISTAYLIRYLFGKDAFLPNTTAFSSAAEAIAGRCLEQFGYKHLMRRLRVMPDLVFETSRAGEAVLALVEAKHSINRPPKWKIEREVAKFLLDVTTRAKSSTYRYEGYLIACQFKDQHIIDCECFYVDLESRRRSEAGSRPPIRSGPVPPYSQPAERLRSILRLVAETADARDPYLNELLSEEAKQTATLKLIEEERPNAKRLATATAASLITDHIRQTASDLGVAKQWRELENDIGELSAVHDLVVKTAVERYTHPRLLEEPQDEPDSAQ